MDSNGQTDVNVEENLETLKKIREHIGKLIDAGNNDNNSIAPESEPTNTEALKGIAELFDQLRRSVGQMEGIDSSLEEQTERMWWLKKHIGTKNDLIQWFKEGEEAAAVSDDSCLDERAGR